MCQATWYWLQHYAPATRETQHERVKGVIPPGPTKVLIPHGLAEPVLDVPPPG